MTAPISKIRYLKRQNLENEARLQAGYFSEIIQQYGVDITYFRRLEDFFDNPTDLSANTYANYTYGQSPTSPYSLSADMVVFMSINEDSPLLKKFGIETSTNAEIVMMRDGFTETWRDIVGTPISNIFVSNVTSNITNYSGILSGQVVGTDLSGVTSAMTTVPSGTISGIYTGGFKRYPVWINPDLYRSEAFTERVVVGGLSGIVTGIIDVSGNGYMNGNVSGTLHYFTTPSLHTGNYWKIAPHVGDIIRLKEFELNDNNFPEYEINEILDQEITPNGVNPHLHKYLWKCAVTRRDPSYETLTGTVQEELFTPNVLPENNWHEIVSNDIFAYTNPVDSVDLENSDNVYGGYSRPSN